MKYPVRKTGFYCVSTYAYSGQDYKAVVTFRNSYGELPAAQIAKLPFYGALTIVYAVIGAYVTCTIHGLDKFSSKCLRIILDSGPSFMCRTVMTSVCCVWFPVAIRAMLTLDSARPKLYHCHCGILDRRAAYDVGILW